MHTLKHVRELNIKQLRIVLAMFTRDQLRALARAWNIPLGRTKPDTVHNLCVTIKDQKNSLKDLIVRIQIM